MLYKFTYEDSELDHRDLKIFYIERGCDEVKEFTIENFVPDDYVLSVVGDEEFELRDYYPQNVITVSYTHLTLPTIYSV